MMNKTEQKVEAFIRANNMIEEGDVVVTGVSGGADSVCLLFMLHGLQERLGFRIAACHVNHGLRGADADADEAYVEKICAELGVPLYVFRENVELIARKRKQSTEEAGRAVRAEAFEQVCTKTGGTKIAAAHHQDDNAETVLLNAARGTGLRGLCGIRPVRGKWIRPLLCIGRKEIESWLRQKGLVWCSDATNEEDDYTRNRVRHNILPALVEQVNRGTSLHLNELSRQAREIWDYLDEKTQEAWEVCVAAEKDVDKGGIEIRKEYFQALAPAIQDLLLRRCICTVADTERDIGAVHVEAVKELLGKQAGKRVNLPENVTAVRIYAGVKLRKEKKNADAFLRETSREPILLKIPGESFFPGTNQTICCTLFDAGDASFGKDIPQKSYTKCFDYDIIKYGLCARTRRIGDYLATGSGNGHQKLKSYFINEKVPREERDGKLLIADGDHVIWIPGMRMSSEYQISRNTKRILMIKITEEKKYGREDQSIDF